VTAVVIYLHYTNNINIYNFLNVEIYCVITTALWSRDGSAVVSLHHGSHVTWFVDFDYDFTTVACATTLADLRHSPMPVRLRGDTSVGRRPLASAASSSVKT